MGLILIETNTYSYIRIPINWVSARAYELALIQNVVRIHECAEPDMRKLRTYGILKFGHNSMLMTISLTDFGKKCLIDDDND